MTFQSVPRDCSFNSGSKWTAADEIEFDFSATFNELRDRLDQHQMAFQFDEPCDADDARNVGQIGGGPQSVGLGVAVDAELHVVAGHPEEAVAVVIARLDQRVEM